MMATKSALDRFSSPSAFDPEPPPYFDEFEHATRGTDRKALKTFRLLPVAEILQREPAPWLVKGLLPRQGVAAIYGPSGCGKSFLTLDLLGAIGRGDTWFDYKTRTTPTIYVCLEGVQGLAQRVNAYIAEVGSLGDMRVIETPYRLVDLNDEAALLECIGQEGLKGAVIVFDTLAQATVGLDENSGEDMTRAIAACQRIQAEIEGLVVLIHHTGKDSTRGLRGHSSLIGALDAAIEVTGGKDGGQRKWSPSKVKDGESGKDYPFELRRVVLGTDDDGDEISSCVISPSESAGESVRRARVPAGGNQRIIWDGLGELLRADGYRSEAPKECPPGRPAVELEQAISKLRDRLTCEEKRKTERTRQAFTGLIVAGLLVSRGGWIWCA